MVKLMFGLRRLPRLSTEEFHRYWREEHGPLARKLLPVLKARRYVQSHALDLSLGDDPRELGGMSEPFDGIVEVWWDSPEELLRAALTEEGAKANLALMEDEKRFIDFSRSAMWFVEEEVFFEDVDRAGQDGE